MYKITLSTSKKTDDQLEDIGRSMCVGLARPVSKIDIEESYKNLVVMTFFAETMVALVGVILNYMGSNEDPYEMGRLVGMIEKVKS